MTYLKKLLNGQKVEWKTLGEVAEFSNIGVDKKINENEKEVKLLNFVDVFRNQYISNKTATMVVTATDKKIIDCDIKKGDVFITPSSELIDEIGFSAMAIEDFENTVYSYHIMRLRINDQNELFPSFLNYLFTSLEIRKQIRQKAQGITRFGLTQPSWKSLLIPIPPLSVQKEIVRILDMFTELIKQLNKELGLELGLRKKQYEYYREKLLTFQPQMNTDEHGFDVEWKMLGEVGEFTYGYVASAQKTGNARFVRISDIGENGKLKSENAVYVEVSESNKKFVLKKNDILMARTGATYGKTMIYEEDYVSLYAGFLIKLQFDNNLINPKYYWHFAQSNFFWSQANKLVSGGGQPQFNANALKQIKIPIPPLSEQERIVSILDKFDTLVNSISEGLPKEIELRQKQYEYYREKLLNFDNI